MLNWFTIFELPASLTFVTFAVFKIYTAYLHNVDLFYKWVRMLAHWHFVIFFMLYHYVLFAISALYQRRLVSQSFPSSRRHEFLRWHIN